MSHPDRPTGKTYDMPQPTMKIGDRVSRDLVMNDVYTPGWYRRQILRHELKRVRTILNGLRAKGYMESWLGYRLPACNKASVLSLMRVIDTAYEVEVSGVLMSGMHVDDNVSNQCYVGGGPGWSGLSPCATLLFRATQPHAWPGQTENHVAVNIVGVTWAEHIILKARLP